MPSGMESGVGRGMSGLDGVVIIEEEGQFWGEFGASNGDLLHSCATATRSSQMTLEHQLLWDLSGRRLSTFCRKP